MAALISPFDLYQDGPPPQIPIVDIDPFSTE